MYCALHACPDGEGNTGLEHNIAIAKAEDIVNHGLMDTGILSPSPSRSLISKILELGHHSYMHDLDESSEVCLHYQSHRGEPNHMALYILEPTVCHTANSVYTMQLYITWTFCLSKPNVPYIIAMKLVL